MASSSKSEIQTLKTRPIAPMLTRDRPSVREPVAPTTKTVEVADLSDKKTARIQKRINKMASRDNDNNRRAWDRAGKGKNVSAQQRRGERIRARIKKLRGKQKKTTQTYTSYILKAK